MKHAAFVMTSANGQTFQSPRIRTIKPQAPSNSIGVGRYGTHTLFGKSRGRSPWCVGLSPILFCGHLCIQLFILIKDCELRGSNLRLKKAVWQSPPQNVVKRFELCVKALYKSLHYLFIYLLFYVVYVKQDTI